MPSTSTIRGVVASSSINKLPAAERELTWKLFWRIDDFHIAKTGASVFGLLAFGVLQIGLGILFAEPNDRDLGIPLWTFLVGAIVGILLDMALRRWYYDAKVAADIEELRREIYMSPDKQNAFRYLMRTVPELLPKQVVAACE